MEKFIGMEVKKIEIEEFVEYTLSDISYAHSIHKPDDLHIFQLFLLDHYFSSHIIAK